MDLTTIYSESFFRKMSWAALLVIGIALLLFQLLPLSESARLLLAALLFFFAVFTFLRLKFFAPLYWQLRWLPYVGVCIDCAFVAACDILIEPIDFSPFYLLVILVYAILALPGPAFFAAALAIVCQALVAWFAGVLYLPQMAINSAVYIVSALFTGTLVRVLIQQWRAASAESERQRRQMAHRRDELQGLAEIAHVFASLEDAGETLRQVTERIAHLLNAEMCVIARLDASGRVVRGMPPGYGLTNEEIAKIEYYADPDILAVWDIAKTESLLLNDVTALPAQFLAVTQGLEVRQIVAARLMRGGRPIGLIFAANKKDGSAFEDKDAQLLSILGGQAGIAIENARLYALTKENLENVTRLYAISSKFASESDPNTIPQRVVDAVAEALRAPISTIALLDRATGQLRYAALRGLPLETANMSFRETGMAMTVVRTRQPRFVEDIQRAENINPITRTWNFRSVACLPIEHADQCMGVLYVNYDEPHQFTPIEKDMLAIFAHQTAIALENARLYTEVQEQAQRDSLTQVYNHMAFLKRLEEQVASALSTGCPLTLIMLDIDYFKQYNDAYGHVVGDQILVAIVGVIRAHIHVTDSVGRWGGEEFGIALPNTDAAQAREVAQRIRETLASTELFAKDGRRITPPMVSQGLATLPTHARDSATLIGLADAALYRAKGRGRDQVRAEGDALPQ